MNLFERARKDFLDYCDFLKDLESLSFLGGHDPMNLVKIHELGYQELSYSLI